ncbi:MAG: TrmO family methyltransferase [Holophagaceae bacterium]|nr:TrmO family methyltransferase [Holophagaceae bacterium]
MAFTLRPIGFVQHTPKKRMRVPKYFVPRKRTTLEFFQPYLPGLTGLFPGFELWIVTYHAPSGRIPTDAWQGGDGVPGVFATSLVERPNPIEFLRARIVDIEQEKGLLQVVGLDVEEGAAILDIRPATSPHHGLTKPGE